MASLPTPAVGDWIVDTRWAVYGANNGKIGRVAAVHSDHLVVRDGVILRRTRRVPVSAIRDIERECVYLNLSAHELDARTMSASCRRSNWRGSASGAVTVLSQKRGR